VDRAYHLRRSWRLGVSYGLERPCCPGCCTNLLDHRVFAFANETLLDQRFFGVLRFDPLAPGPVSPFIAAGVGKGRSAASLYRVHCTPHERSGWTAEVGAGVDVVVSQGRRELDAEASSPMRPVAKEPGPRPGPRPVLRPRRPGPRRSTPGPPDRPRARRPGPRCARRGSGSFFSTSPCSTPRCRMKPDRPRFPLRVKAGSRAP
jgi:hypothetical protein